MIQPIRRYIYFRHSNDPVWGREIKLTVWRFTFTVSYNKPISDEAWDCSFEFDD